MKSRFYIVFCGALVTVLGCSKETPERTVTALDLSVSQDKADGVYLSWKPINKAKQYTILRDGEVLTTLPADVHTYVDTDVKGPEVTADDALKFGIKNLTATQGHRTDGVELTWDMLSGIDGEMHTYQVVAGDEVTSEEMKGKRALAFAIEIAAGDNDYENIGAVHSYLDENAPKVDPTTIQVTGPERNAFGDVLKWSATSLGGASAVTYRVRMKLQVEGQDRFTDASTAVGFRGAENYTYQWQRSTADQDADYMDELGATSNEWVDSASSPGVHFWRYVTRLNGEIVAATTPIRAERFPLTMLSGGYNHTCGIRSDGHVICRGDNTNGQTSPPNDVFRAIASAGYSVCGILPDDHVKCWGHNAYDEAPPGPSADTFKQVAGGFYHFCGVRSDDKRVCWGAHQVGGDFGQAPSEPSTETFMQVTAGYHHSCGLKTDGHVVCWGRNDKGQIPAQPLTDTFKSIVSGYFHGCGIRVDDTVSCWGHNEFGEGTPPAGNLKFKALAAGKRHTCGIKTNGKLICWGYNDAGQQNIPSQTDTYKALGSGFYHACAIRSDDRTFCWGNNDFGQAPHS